MKNLEHLKTLRKERFDLVESLKGKYDKLDIDKYKYHYHSVLRDSLLFSTASYCIDHNVVCCKKNLHKSAEMRLILLKGYDVGKPVDYSHVTMLVYIDLLNALASGDIVFAEEFAQKMGGRGKIDTEVHPFDYKLGYCLKYLVLNEKEQALEWYEKFAEQCTKKGFKSYSGFVKILKGILDENSSLAQEGFDEFKKGYKVLIRLGSSSAHSEWLNHWGIGIANLAISRGLKLDINDEYIPKDLLIEV